MGAKRKYNFTDEQEKDIVDSYTGWNPPSLKDLGARYGCSMNPIRRVLLEFGITGADRGVRLPDALYLSEDYREGFVNGWRAALSAMKPPKEGWDPWQLAWERVYGHWKRNLVPWQGPGFEDVPPPTLLRRR